MRLGSRGAHLFAIGIIENCGMAAAWFGSGSWEKVCQAAAVCSGTLTGTCMGKLLVRGFKVCMAAKEDSLVLLRQLPAQVVISFVRLLHFPSGPWIGMCIGKLLRADVMSAK